MSIVLIISLWLLNWPLTFRRQAIERLKAHYDGYYFAWPSPDMFNPFSLLNCFSECRFNSYWFGSGTPN